MARIAILSVLFCLLETVPGSAQEPASLPGDRMISEYFRLQTDQISRDKLTDIRSRQRWLEKRGEYRSQLKEMLGLDPWPEKTDLKATITGTTDHDDFVVENLHFQSRPGLYVTGNLYRPKKVDKRLPAILYVCGHARAKKGGVSYGNKTSYQHHGGWFARNGYVCLTIDTLQMGEIEGIHHGTYREKMWWWLNRGYTPAGVEAWNCVRALDYLQTRAEVDPDRIGVTGRSGGGAYSWWIAAIDDRIKCAVPVAGITDLQNHVVDGCVEGHCDCMYMVNTHRWDYAKVAALVAPRPLLISNTDRDGIFPLDGVYRTFQQTRHIYSLFGAEKDVALNITAGPHKDTQELRVHAFRWFNHYLKKSDALVDKTAVKFFQPEQLQALKTIPKGARNARIQESFVPTAATPALPKDEEAWSRRVKSWKQALSHKCFAAWPTEPGPLNVKPAFDVRQNGVRLRAFDFDAQQAIRLRLFVAHRAGLDAPKLVVLNVLDEESWSEFVSTYSVAFSKQLSADDGKHKPSRKQYDETTKMFRAFPWAMAYVAPRGIGPTRWNQTEFKQTQHRRRFYLLGQSLDGMRTYDVRRTIQTLRKQTPFEATPTWLQSHRRMAGVTLYASLFEPGIRRLDLYELPHTHRQGPFLLNVRRVLDIPQTVAMAAASSKVVIYDTNNKAWRYPTAVAMKLNRKSLQIRRPPGQGNGPPSKSGN